MLTEEQMRDALRQCPHDTVENLRVRWLYAKDFARAIESAATAPLLAEIERLTRELEEAPSRTLLDAATKEIDNLTRELEEARKDAGRWRWIWNHAHNVSFTYRIDPITSATVMRLHCGSLADVVDAAIRAAIKEQT